MTIRIDVAFSVKAAWAEQIRNRQVCVIDVLRATTTIAVALEQGVKAVWPAVEIEEAMTLRDRLAGSQTPVILAGERDGDPPPGFDMGNSPLEAARRSLEGSHFILTTTNGTRALIRAASEGAFAVYTGAFVNAAAVVEKLVAEISDHPDILLFAAGTRGEASLEDTACAGYLVEQLQSRIPGAQITDAALLALHAYHAVAEHWPRSLYEGSHARSLLAKGYGDDLAACFQIDTATCVGVLNGDRILKDSTNPR